MPVVASWIREKVEPHFAASFAVLGRPDLELRNARRGDAIDLRSADAVLITGGEDISAEFLHQAVPNPALIEDPVPDRDAWEFAAVAAAVERGIPLLGICKGHQLINVALGGTLHLDIPGHNRPEEKSANLQPLRHDSGNPA